MTSELLFKAHGLKVDYDNTLSKYLEERGWSYTCDTPGAYWYWQRTLDDGRIVLLSKENAVQMQTEIDRA